MSTELVKPENGLLNLEQFGITTELSEDDADLVKSADYLPQIRVYGSECTVVKKQQFPMGHLGLYHAKNNISDLGESFDCLCIVARPRASIVSGDSPVSYYDKSTNEFQAIKLAALSKTDGYLFGFEYLVWVPDQVCFALFFMGSPTLRRESANVHGRLNLASTLRIKLIEGKNHTWHGAEISECTTPFDLPPADKLLKQVEKFRNPEGSQVELASDGGNGDAVSGRIR